LETGTQYVEIAWMNRQKTGQLERIAPSHGCLPSNNVMLHNSAQLAKVFVQKLSLIVS